MIDRYSKIVLTVIAASLVAIVVQNGMGSLNAQTQPRIQKVAICDPDATNECAGVVSIFETTGSSKPTRYLYTAARLPSKQ
jgi:hypothetical protein